MLNSHIFISKAKIQRNVIEFNIKRSWREAFYEACIWIFSDFRIILSVWFYPLFPIEEWRNLSFQLNFWFVKCVAKFQFLRPKYYNFYTQNLKIWRKAKNSWTFAYILTMKSRSPINLTNFFIKSNKILKKQKKSRCVRIGIPKGLIWAYVILIRVKVVGI